MKPLPVWAAMKLTEFSADHRGFGKRVLSISEQMSVAVWSTAPQDPCRSRSLNGRRGYQGRGDEVCVSPPFTALVWRRWSTLPLPLPPSQVRFLAAPC